MLDCDIVLLFEIKTKRMNEQMKKEQNKISGRFFSTKFARI